MHTLLKQHIASAAVVIIAASFSFGCETRETELRASYNYNVQPGQKSDSRRKQNDAAFLLEASNDLSLEVRLAELAVKEASSPQVKEFAISVLTEHAIALEEIDALASRLDVSLPQTISVASEKHYSLLARKGGLQFDRAYCDFMSENNSIVLKKFEKIVQDGNNELVKDWAWGKLGILRRQIELAQNIDNMRSDIATSIE